MMDISKQARPVVEFIKDNDNFVVVSHYDADGLASAGIINTVLERLGKTYECIPTKQLDSERIELIKGKGDHYIFVDFGSGQIPTIEQNLDSFAIIDHHETLGRTDKPHFNAHLFGLDGAKEISGAGMTYLVAKAIDGSNRDLSALAIVGAVGDMQDSTGKLIGFNRKILEDAVQANVLEYKNDIRLFGRHSRPLIQFLMYSTEPIFPGLTANEQGCIHFLNELGIPLKDDDTWLYYVDLTEEQKRRLISGLYVYGKRQNIPEFILKALVGEVYELKNERDKTFVKDAKDFATLLNACGRHEQGIIGVKVCMGDRETYYKRAEQLLAMHRKMLSEGIRYAQEKGVEEREHCYVLNAGNHIKDTLIGVVAGMLYGAQVIEQSKPILAFSIDESGKLKCSGRATWSLVRRGLHLGKAMKNAASSVGGEGGGHSIAAGARIPKEKYEEFIQIIDSIIAEQMKQ